MNPKKASVLDSIIGFVKRKLLPNSSGIFTDIENYSVDDDVKRILEEKSEENFQNDSSHLVLMEESIEKVDHGDELQNDEEKKDSLQHEDKSEELQIIKIHSSGSSDEEKESKKNVKEVKEKQSDISGYEVRGENENNFTENNLHPNKGKSEFMKKENNKEKFLNRLYSLTWYNYNNKLNISPDRSYLDLMSINIPDISKQIGIKTNIDVDKTFKDILESISENKYEEYEDFIGFIYNEDTNKFGIDLNNSKNFIYFGQKKLINYQYKYDGFGILVRVGEMSPYANIYIGNFHEGEQSDFGIYSSDYKIYAIKQKSNNKFFNESFIFDDDIKYNVVNNTLYYSNMTYIRKDPHAVILLRDLVTRDKEAKIEEDKKDDISHVDETDIFDIDKFDNQYSGILIKKFFKVALQNISDIVINDRKEIFLNLNSILSVKKEIRSIINSNETNKSYFNGLCVFLNSDDDNIIYEYGILFTSHYIYLGEFCGNNFNGKGLLVFTYKFEGRNDFIGYYGNFNQNKKIGKGLVIVPAAGTNFDSKENIAIAETYWDNNILIHDNDHKYFNEKRNIFNISDLSNIRNYFQNVDSIFAKIKQNVKFIQYRKYISNLNLEKNINDKINGKDGKILPKNFNMSKHENINDLFTKHISIKLEYNEFNFIYDDKSSEKNILLELIKVCYMKLILLIQEHYNEFITKSYGKIDSTIYEVYKLQIFYFEKKSNSVLCNNIGEIKEILTNIEKTYSSIKIEDEFMDMLKHVYLHTINSFNDLVENICNKISLKILDKIYPSIIKLIIQDNKNHRMKTFLLNYFNMSFIRSIMSEENFKFNKIHINSLLSLKNIIYEYLHVVYSKIGKDHLSPHDKTLDKLPLLLIPSNVLDNVMVGFNQLEYVSYTLSKFCSKNLIYDFLSYYININKNLLNLLYNYDIITFLKINN